MESWTFRSSYHEDLRGIVLQEQKAGSRKLENKGSGKLENKGCRKVAPKSSSLLTLHSLPCHDLVVQTTKVKSRAICSPKFIISFLLDICNRQKHVPILYNSTLFYIRPLSLPGLEGPYLSHAFQFPIKTSMLSVLSDSGKVGPPITYITIICQTLRILPRSSCH